MYKASDVILHGHEGFYHVGKLETHWALAVGKLGQIRIFLLATPIRPSHLIVASAVRKLVLEA